MRAIHVILNGLWQSHRSLKQDISLMFVVLTLIVQSTRATPPPGLPESDVALRVNGPDLVDADGNTVILRAINLGNWFLIEPWLYAQPSAIRDQATFFGVLASRFGADEADRLIGLHRDNWIIQRDFDMIASAGFNCVRVPIHFSVLESAPFTYDEAGFGRIRSVLEMAEQSGLYVILDMHGAPGGQSLDQPSGDATANDLWTDPVAQERFAWLWQHIARRFKNSRNFVGYDLLNEPYGDFSSDISDELLQIMDRTIRAIREIDQERLVLVPGTLDGIGFYGSLTDRGWINAGFTEHFYPGLFDSSEPTLGTHARFLATTLRERAEYTRSLDAPYLWGELNPVLDQAGAPYTTRVMLDAAEELGVHAAVWLYKQYSPAGTVGPNNWYLVTNGQPLGFGDVRTTFKAQIESAFQGHATVPLAVDQTYLNVLTSDQTPDVLPDVEIPPLVPPTIDGWSGWSIFDVGNVGRPGGQAVTAGGLLGADQLTLYAAGQDLFNQSDSFRLAARQPPSNYLFSTVLQAFEGNTYAHAGLTIRATAEPSSPHLSVFAFPNGRILVKARNNSGGFTSQRYIATTGFPVGMAIGRSSGQYIAWLTDEDGQWQQIPISESPALGGSPLAGFFGLANRSGPLTVIDFESPTISPPNSLPAPLPLDSGTNLLFNSSFESTLSNGQAAGWPSYGGNFERESGWTPVRDGQALLAYKHWQVTSNQPSGVYQDVTGLTPGQEYVFTVYSNRDQVMGGGTLPDQVELRIETIGSTNMRLESSFQGVPEIASGSRWSRSQLRFVATDTRHRVSIVVYPGLGIRDGAIKFDGIRLETE